VGQPLICLDCYGHSFDSGVDDENHGRFGAEVGSVVPLVDQFDEGVSRLEEKSLAVLGVHLQFTLEEDASVDDWMLVHRQLRAGWDGDLEHGHLRLTCGISGQRVAVPAFGRFDECLNDDGPGFVRENRRGDRGEKEPADEGDGGLGNRSPFHWRGAI